MTKREKKLIYLLGQFTDDTLPWKNRSSTASEIVQGYSCTDSDVVSTDNGREMTIVVDGLTVAKTTRPTFEVHSYDGVIWDGNDEKIGRTIVEEHGEYAVLVSVYHDMMVTRRRFID